jgi:hypothetical protein
MDWNAVWVRYELNYRGLNVRLYTYSRGEHVLISDRMTLDAVKNYVSESMQPYGQVPEWTASKDGGWSVEKTQCVRVK